MTKQPKKSKSKKKIATPEPKPEQPSAGEMAARIERAAAAVGAAKQEKPATTAETDTLSQDGLGVIVVSETTPQAPPAPPEEITLKVTSIRETKECLVVGFVDGDGRAVVRWPYKQGGGVKRWTKDADGSGGTVVIDRATAKRWKLNWQQVVGQKAA